MKEQEIKDFLDKNQEAFKILKQKIKNIDTVVGVATVKEFQGRQRAIQVINEWLAEIWGIAYPELPDVEEEDEIYRTINKNQDGM